MDALEKKVSESVDSLIDHEGFKLWNNQIKWQKGDILLFNNSFVFRDVKTTKSQLYLGRHVLDDVTFGDIVVVTSTNFNSDFKRVPEKSAATYESEKLADAIKNQLENIGRLLFVLIGEVDDSVEISEPTSDDSYSEIVWNPKLSENVKVDNGKIYIRETYDEELIWTDLLKLIGDDVDSDVMKHVLGEALDKLQDRALANLTIPAKGESISDESVINSICRILEKERQSYSCALNKLPDPQSLTEVLRIAYNFAGDATEFIRLVVSICDLKPIILWGTIAEHYALSESFRKLPWTRRKNKASLKNYEATIKDARNSAFHNLFPFRKSLSITLPEDALGSTELRIFSEHSKKKDNTLNYQDKPLVDVLTGFTRAREVRVPERFWRQNVKVMDATLALFRQTDSVAQELLQHTKP